jgi:hypothetical protein
VNQDLRRRGIYPARDVPLKECQDLLRKQLLYEWKYLAAMEGINHGESGHSEATFLLITCVPCILHLENRVGLKIIKLLLRNGLTRAQNGHLFEDVASENERIDRFFDQLHQLVNHRILGDDEGPSMFKCPYDPAKKIITEITMDNTKTRKMLSKIELLIDLCCAGDATINRWKRACQYYNESMVLLRSRNDFTDQDIGNYQRTADHFVQVWIGLHGNEGMTNYVHLMASGHLSTYLYHWRNLYVHSQQGWEAYNSMLKTFYFCRTQRGGSTNAGKSMKTRLEPIARWLQRRMVGMLGLTWEEIQQIVHEKDPPVGGLPMVEDDDEIDNDNDDDLLYFGEEDEHNGADDGVDGAVEDGFEGGMESEEQE